MAFALCFFLGWGLIGRYIPAHSPMMTAAEVSELYQASAMAHWLPMSVFGTWLMVTFVMLRNGVKRQMQMAPS